MREHLTRMMY